MPVTHAFTSPKADGADATLVRPSNWNAAHTITGVVENVLFDAKGDILIATAADTPARLAAGANDTILMADSGAAEGLKWAASAAPAAETFGAAQAIGTTDTFARGDHVHAMPADPVTNHAAAADPHTGYVLESLFAAKGDLIVATAADVPGILTAGANDTILMADSVAVTGLKWVAAQAPSAETFGAAQAIGTADTFARGDHVHAMPADPVTAHASAGDPHTGYRLESADHTHASTGLQAGAVSHTVLTGLLNDEHTQYQKEADWTAKGDLMSASSGGVTARLAVGADDTILMADSVAGTGLKWVASAAPAAETFGTGQVTGTSDTFARGDHVHAMPADPVVNHAAAADPHTGYVLESAINAKGDLYAGTADNTPGVLTVGANDTILMADSAAGPGLKWVASQTPSTQVSGDGAVEGTADTYARGDHKHAFPVLFQSIDFAKSGTLVIGAGTARWYNRSGRTLTFDSVTASVGTAPTGASVIVDVNKGGTTIYTTQANRPTIAVGTNTHDDTTAPNVTTILDNEYLTIDIDQVGSTVAGADLTVQVWLRG